MSDPTLQADPHPRIRLPSEMNFLSVGRLKPEPVAAPVAAPDQRLRLATATGDRDRDWRPRLATATATGDRDRDWRPRLD